MFGTEPKAAARASTWRPGGGQRSARCARRSAGKRKRACRKPPLSNSSNPPHRNSAGYNGPVMVLPDDEMFPDHQRQCQARRRALSPARGAPGFRRTRSSGSSGAQLPSGVAIQQNALNGQQNRTGFARTTAAADGAAGLINQILTSPRPGGHQRLGGSGGDHQRNIRYVRYCAHRGHCYNGHRSSRRTNRSSARSWPAWPASASRKASRLTTSARSTTSGSSCTIFEGPYEEAQRGYRRSGREPAGGSGQRRQPRSVEPVDVRRQSAPANVAAPPTSPDRATAVQ